MGNLQLNVTDRAELGNKGVLAILTQGRLPSTKADRAATKAVETTFGATEGSVSGRKRVFAKTARLKAVREAYNALRSYHLSHTLEWFESGPRILPNQFILQYRQQIDQLAANYEQAARELAAHIDEERAAAMTDNGALYNPDDIPDGDVIIKLCYTRLRIVPLPSAADFKQEVSAEIRRELEAELEAAHRLAMTDIFRRVAEPLAAMQQKLASAAPDGKIKLFNSMTGNIRDAATTMLSSGFVDDPQLEAFLVKATKLADAADKFGGRLREDHTARQQVADATEAVLEQFKGMF